MKIRTICISLCFVFCACLSCKRTAVPYVELSSTRVHLNYEIDTIEIIVRANYDWSASVADDWCKLLERENDSVMRIAVALNEGAELRQNVIAIVSQDVQTKFLIIQTAYPGGFGRFRDSTSLVDLYNSCGGAQWEFFFEGKQLKPWDLSSSITEWQGVTTARVDGAMRVSSLDLRGVGLGGKVPESFATLTELSFLLLSTYIDLELDVRLLAKLPRLEMLDVSYTNFVPAFSLPDDIGGLENLVYLNLSGVDFGGAVPRNIEKISNLHSLILDNCNIKGEVSPVFRSLKGLAVLSLSSNPLGGTLPFWIGELSALESLDLSGCDLTGAIPPALGQLSKLSTLKLGFNKFSGAIPSSVGGLTRLEILNLAECGLSGSIPAEIANAVNIEYLDLSFNNLEGFIPTSIGSLRFLKYLMVSGNRLGGEIPASVRNSARWADSEEGWYPTSNICPQQVGYGFSNCE